MTQREKGILMKETNAHMCKSLIRSFDALCERLHFTAVNSLKYVNAQNDECFGSIMVALGGSALHRDDKQRFGAEEACAPLKDPPGRRCSASYPHQACSVEPDSLNCCVGLLVQMD